MEQGVEGFGVLTTGKVDDTQLALHLFSEGQVFGLSALVEQTAFKSGIGNTIGRSRLHWKVAAYLCEQGSGFIDLAIAKQKFRLEPFGDWRGARLFDPALRHFHLAGLVSRQSQLLSGFHVLDLRGLNGFEPNLHGFLQRVPAIRRWSDKRGPREQSSERLLGRTVHVDEGAVGSPGNDIRGDDTLGARMGGQRT